VRSKFEMTTERTFDRLLPLVLLVAAVALISGGPGSMTGDSPHYLAASDSISRDRDLDLTNQYEPGSDYLFAPDQASGHAVPGRDGKLFPFHPLGLSLLYAPIVGPVQALVRRVPEPVLTMLRWDRARAGRDLLSLTMACLWIACALMTRELALRLGVERRQATVVVAVAFLTPPLLNHSILIFSEIPAAALTLAFVLLMLGQRRLSWLPFVPLALLPWFHLRYSVIALAGFAWWLASAWTSSESPRRSLWIGSGVALGSVFVLCAANWAMFETWSLFGHYQDKATELALDGVLYRAARIAVDPHRGILVLAPFYLLAISGGRQAAHVDRGYSLFVAAMAASTFLLASANQLWWGGYSPPARFLVPILPLLVPMLSFGIDQLRRRRMVWLAGVLFAWSLFLSVLLVSNPINIWSEPETDRGVMARVLGLFGSDPPATSP